MSHRNGGGGVARIGAGWYSWAQFSSFRSNAMKSVLRLALCAAALIASQPILAGPAAAQDAQRIAAVVNDEIVSMHDLRARLQMVIVSSRLPATDETAQRIARSEEHTSELQSLMRISYAVFCLK